VAASLKFFLQVAVVINLAIEDNRYGIRASRDWLLSAYQVNDRKSTHAKRDRATDQHPLIVRPSMCYPTTHPIEHQRAFGLIWKVVLRYESSNPTHLNLPSDQVGQ
jgi:hypothetical protein